MITGCASGRPAGDEPTDVDAVVEAVEANRDAIVVPASLLEEPEPPPRPPDKALWAQIRDMTVAERVKLALRGNKDVRTLLMRDPNRQIPRLVMKNPRITEEEILTLAKDRNTQEEILTIIADSREWSKIHTVRLSLVENARTPASRSFRLLETLVERDLARIGKSKNVPTAIAAQARRLVNARQRRR